MDILFLDANVLFSAAYRESSKMRQLWMFTDVELVTSVYASEEARRNLTRPEHRQSLSELLDSLRLMSFAAKTPWPVQEVSLPPDDQPILLAAIDAGASHLLTGNHRHFGPHYGKTIQSVLILPPGDYLRERATRPHVHEP